LLATSIYWVVLPIYPLLILFFAGIWDIPEKRIVITITFLSAIGMGIYGYLLNKRRVKNEIDPRIKRVDLLIREFER